MKRLDRYKAQLDELRRHRGDMLRTGNLVKAMNLGKEIQEVERLIAEAEEYEPKPISESLTREEVDEMGIIPRMIECHLILDLLVDAAYDIKDRCEAKGLTGVKFVPELDEILQKAECFASFLTKVSPELCDMLVRNDTLNASQHKKFQNYIAQRLKAPQGYLSTKNS